MQMTDQEAYDKVVTHLLTQMKKCEHGIKPAYKIGHLRCAIGILIPDNHISFDSTLIVSDLIKLYPDLPFKDVTPSLLKTLQECHDHFTPNMWPKELYDIGLLHGLNLKVLKPYMDVSDFDVDMEC